MYQATLRVLCNTFCNILFFSQPFSLIDKCILICGVIFVNCYIVLSKLFAVYIFIQKKRLRKTDAKFHIMDSGTKYTEQSSMAIICPQSGSRLSPLPLLRFRRHLSKISFSKLAYTCFLIKSSVVFMLPKQPCQNNLSELWIPSVNHPSGFPCPIKTFFPSKTNP